MTTSDYAVDSALNDIIEDQTPVAAASEKRSSKKGLLFGFGATVTVGLGLTIWYLGTRIVTADAPVSTPAQPRATAPSITPAPPRAFFLEVPALGPKQDSVFLRTLDAKGLHAEVETPDAGATRILIGPFATQVESQQAQRKLAGDGVLALEASH